MKLIPFLQYTPFRYIGTIKQNFYCNKTKISNKNKQQVFIYRSLTLDTANIYWTQQPFWPFLNLSLDFGRYFSKN